MTGIRRLPWFLLFIIASANAFAESQPFGGQTVRDFAQANQVMEMLVKTSPVRGDKAPNLTLQSSDGSGAVGLSQLWKDKPLALIFGSLTCDVSCDFSKEVLKIHQLYGEQVQVAYVYIREAHPKNGWVTEPPYSVIEDPKTIAERISAAARFEALTNYPFPVLVDNLDDEAAKSFAAWPNRYVVIDTDGTLSFVGALGPWGFRPLRDSVYLDMASGAPFVPKNHERHSLQAHLDRRLGIDLAAADKYSGKTITTLEMLGDVVFSRIENVPLVGDKAPNPKLRKADQAAKVPLSDYWKDKPAVITFGSTTAGPTHAGKNAMKALFEEFGDRAQFVHVQIREAQPIDGVYHASLSTISDPKTIEERAVAARQLQEKLEIEYPVLVDSMNDEAAILFSAFPVRTVVVDTNGLVVYRGYQGPFRFKPTEAFVPEFANYRAPQLASMRDVVSVEAFLKRYLKDAE